MKMITFVSRGLVFATVATACVFGAGVELTMADDNKEHFLDRSRKVDLPASRKWIRAEKKTMRRLTPQYPQKEKKPGKANVSVFIVREENKKRSEQNNFAAKEQTGKGLIRGNRIEGDVSGVRVTFRKLVGASARGRQYEYAGDRLSDKYGRCRGFADTWGTKYLVTPVKVGYEFDPPQRFVTVGDRSSNVQFRIRRKNTTISVRVHFGSGRDGLRNVTVEYKNLSTGGVRHQVTNGSGRCPDVWGYSSHSYRITPIAPDGYRIIPRSAHVQVGDNPVSLVFRGYVIAIAVDR